MGCQQTTCGILSTAFQQPPPETESGSCSSSQTHLAEVPCDLPERIQNPNNWARRLRGCCHISSLFTQLLVWSLVKAPGKDRTLGATTSTDWLLEKAEGALTYVEVFGS